MKKYKDLKYLVFGYKDRTTGKKLGEFYFKYTGKKVNFNYKDGFKLLCFTLPLGSFHTIGITEAIYRPAKEYMKFHDGVDKLISWYENEYLLFQDYEIIKHIPHASLKFPPYFGEMLLSKSKISNYKMTDLFVDELFKNIEGVEVKASYSRIYCDVERYKDDEKEEMAKYGQGYMYTKGYFDEPIFRHSSYCSIDVDHATDAYYDAHHALLTKETKNILEKNKKVLLLDLHSYSDEQADKVGKKGPYPDICIGYNNECYDEKVLNHIIKVIKAKGYSYKINYPYEGSIIPNGLTSKEKSNVCSIMIEVNKRLYL